METDDPVTSAIDPTAVADNDHPMNDETDAAKAEQGVDRAKSAERIRELNAIDQDVTQSLQAAGAAIKALTEPASDAGEGDDVSALESSKAAFQQHTNEYFRLVQSVAARLRRQVYALEEAGIIASNQASMEQQVPPPPPSRQTANPRGTAARTGTTAAAMLQQRVEPPMEITNGGLGNMDVGWLNSRSDKVGRQMEAELWAQAREQLENMRQEDSNDDAGTAQSPGVAAKMETADDDE